MNKRLDVNELIAGPGLVKAENNSVTNSQWVNNEYYDIHKTLTTLSLDTHFITNQFEQSLRMFGPMIVEEQLRRLIKEKIRFDMVSWINDDGLPEVTCQLFYGDKMIEEKTTVITKEGVENVASPT